MSAAEATGVLAGKIALICCVPTKIGIALKLVLPEVTRTETPPSLGWSGYASAGLEDGPKFEP